MLTSSVYTTSGVLSSDSTTISKTTNKTTSSRLNSTATSSSQAINHKTQGMLIFTFYNKRVQYFACLFGKLYILLVNIPFLVA